MHLDANSVGLLIQVALRNTPEDVLEKYVNAAQTAHEDLWRANDPKLPLAAAAASAIAIMAQTCKVLGLDNKELEALLADYMAGCVKRVINDTTRNKYDA